MNCKSNKGFTYNDKRNGTKSRLDYILVGECMKSNMKNVQNHNITFIPDHLAVSVNIRLSLNKRGPGYWKLNASILNDDKLKDCIKQEIKMVENEFLESVTSKRVFWEILKIRVKDACIQYSKNRMYSLKKKRTELQKCIDEISINIMNNAYDDDTH